MATWNIDTNHSEITFKVKHLVISTVTGKFKNFEGSVESDKDDFSDAKASFSAEINSIETGNEQRDGHLKSADFFDAGTHPTLTFKSTSMAPQGNNEFLVKGDLTIRGTTKPITLQADFGGIQQDFSGNTVAGFELNGKINRKEFGLHWNGVTEAGGVVVSDEVRIHINVELIRK